MRVLHLPANVCREPVRAHPELAALQLGREGVSVGRVRLQRKPAAVRVPAEHGLPALLLQRGTELVGVRPGRGMPVGLVRLQRRAGAAGVLAEHGLPQDVHLMRSVEVRPRLTLRRGRP